MELQGHVHVKVIRVGGGGGKARRRSSRQQPADDDDDDEEERPGVDILEYHSHLVIFAAGHIFKVINELAKESKQTNGKWARNHLCVFEFDQKPLPESDEEMMKTVTDMRRGAASPSHLLIVAHIVSQLIVLSTAHDGKMRLSPAAFAIFRAADTENVQKSNALNRVKGCGGASRRPRDARPPRPDPSSTL